MTAPPAPFNPSAPHIVTEPVDHCPLCGCNANSPYADGFDYEIETCANHWRFVSCRDCAHVWLNPRPAMSELPVIYPPSYYAYNYASSIHPLALRGKEWLDRLKFRRILRALNRSPRTYLDVGCGNGRFLKLMEKQGLARENLYGIELDKTVSADLSRAGYRVFCEPVEQCRQIPPGQLDLITIFHVIEHVADPKAVIKQLCSWLAPGGVLAIETPNLDSWDARLFRKTYWGGYHIPRHWHLFRPETLTKTLAESGLEVVGTAYQTGHSFWLYSFHHLLRYGKPSRPALARWMRPIGGNILPLLAVTGLDTLRAMLGFRTSAMLILARKPK